MRAITTLREVGLWPTPVIISHKGFQATVYYGWQIKVACLYLKARAAQGRSKEVW